MLRLHAEGGLVGVESVDRVKLAGAFGSQIDLLHAMVLGLYPDCDLSRVSSAGNAAGTGALIAPHPAAEADCQLHQLTPVAP